MNLKVFWTEVTLFGEGARTDCADFVTLLTKAAQERRTASFSGWVPFRRFSGNIRIRSGRSAVW